MNDKHSNQFLKFLFTKNGKYPTGKYAIAWPLLEDLIKVSLQMNDKQSNQFLKILIYKKWKISGYVNFQDGL